MAYTDLQKMTAVEIVQRNAGRIDAVTLALVRKVVNAPDLSERTIRNWMHGNFRKENSDIKSDTSMPIEQALRQALDAESELEAAVAEALDQMFENTARLYLKQSQKDEVIGATKGKDAVIAAATAVDKMRLLRNLPTEIVAVLPNLLDAIDRKGLKASEVFGAMLEELTRVDGD